MDMRRGWCFVTVAFGWTWTLGFSAAALGGGAGRALVQVALLGPVVGVFVILWADPALARARDLLRRRAGAGPGVLRSGLVLAALWSTWEVPLYFVDGSPLHGLDPGSAAFWGSLAARPPLALLAVWVTRPRRRTVVAPHRAGSC
ncbi:hypothetical protein [Nocardioides pacificus]